MGLIKFGQHSQASNSSILQSLKNITQQMSFRVITYITELTILLRILKKERIIEVTLKMWEQEFWNREHTWVENVLVQIRRKHSSWAEHVLVGTQIYCTNTVMEGLERLELK